MEARGILPLETNRASISTATVGRRHGHRLGIRELNAMLSEKTSLNVTSAPPAGVSWWPPHPQNPETTECSIRRMRPQAASWFRKESCSLCGSAGWTVRRNALWVE